MIKSLVYIFVFTVTLFSQNINYGVLNKHAFVLPKDKVEIKSAYLKVNDTIDVLNIKEKELGSLSSLGSSIGDMNGYDFEVRYGITSKDSLFVNYKRYNVEYSDTTLKNDKINIFNRHNLSSNNYSFINSLYVDVGYTQDSSSPIAISNESLLNSMIKKIRPSSSISLKDGTIVSGDTTLSLYDKDYNKIHPYIAIENLASKSYYTRVLFGKKISDYSFLDIYFGYLTSDIKTKIVFKPNDIKALNSFISSYTKNLDRDEQSANVGFVYIGQFDKNIFEFNYEYTKIFRDSSVSGIDYSHSIESTISRVIDKNLLFYLGGKLMMQQFNSEIPYLYNKYTASQFDKKYGYAQIGILYSF